MSEIGCPFPEGYPSDVAADMVVRQIFDLPYHECEAEMDRLDAARESEALSAKVSYALFVVKGRIRRRLEGVSEQFTAVHGAPDSGPSCSAAAACFGGSFVNDESGPGPTYEFDGVAPDGGIVDGYSMNFRTGTTIADVKSAVLAWLPRDTVTTLYQVNNNNGSCVLWNLRSPTLARELGTPAIGDPQGDLGVRLGYVTSDLTNLYDPNNVQHADISVLPNSPTDSC